MGAVSRTARAQPGAAPAQRSHRPIRPYRGPLLGTSGRSLISLSPARQGTRGSPKHRVAGGMLLLSRYLQEYCLQGSTHRFAPNFETLTLKAAPLDKCQIRVVDQPQIAVGIVCDRYGVVVVGARVPVLREREYRLDTAASGSVALLPLFLRGILSRPTFWAEHLIRCVLMDAACGPTSQCTMDGTPSHIGAGDE